MEALNRSATLPVGEQLRHVREKVRHFERICSSLQRDPHAQWQLSRTPYLRRTSTSSRQPSTPHPNTTYAEPFLFGHHVFVLPLAMFQVVRHDALSMLLYLSLSLSLSNLKLLSNSEVTCELSSNSH
jgi:hypothetical protein